MADFVKVAQTNDVPHNSVILVTVGGQEIALINLEGQFYAMADICSHAHCALSDGDLEGDELVCPCHGSGFHVKTGEVSSPPAQEGAVIFPVQVSGDDILVAI